MMMNVLAGVAAWMVAAIGLGLMFGRAMHGYAVNGQPERARLTDTDSTPSYTRAA